MDRRVGLACMIAAILVVFAYSAFINVQRDKNPKSEQSVGQH